MCYCLQISVSVCVCVCVCECVCVCFSPSVFAVDRVSLRLICPGVDAGLVCPPSLHQCVCVTYNLCVSTVLVRMLCVFVFINKVGVE